MERGKALYLLGEAARDSEKATPVPRKTEADPRQEITPPPQEQNVEFPNWEKTTKHLD